MNEDKIERSSLEAGRKTDALVWLAIYRKEAGWDGKSALGCRYVDGDVQPYAGHPVGHISPPNYSTDMGATWEIVLHMLEHAYGFELYYDAFAWYCKFDPSKDEEWIKAKTAPLAICRAMREALGEARREK